MAPKSLSDLKRKELFQTKGYIDSEWVDAASGKTLDVHDPATLNKIATLPEMGKDETRKAIKSAHTAFQSYKKTSARQRARWLRKWSDLCLEHIKDLTLILTLENGKTLTEAKGEVTYAASFLEWFAAEAERVHGEVVVPTANLNQRILTLKQPLGVAACLAPWNLPYRYDYPQGGCCLGGRMHHSVEAGRGNATQLPGTGRSCLRGWVPGRRYQCPHHSESGCRGGRRALQEQIGLEN